MHRRFLTAPVFVAIVTLSLLSPLFAQNPGKVELVAPTEALTPAEQLKKFHLPPGFKIELIASEPLVGKPINMAFDARGRLYVTQSVEYPYPTKESQPRDTIRLITDTNGDGVPDKVSTFADGLNIPIGVVPLADRVLGFSIPSIYRFDDKDGDGKSESRQELYGTFGQDDTHGMASSFSWWLDGWIYGCHGFRNTSTVKGSDGKPITMNSGNTYRFRPDGTHIEHYTWGQVNPFGMTFDPLGNLYTADCHSKPIYMLLRGAYYPSFGKPHDGLGFGPDMITHTHYSTGICGIVYYAADQFPRDYHNTIFICNPVTGRVNHDKLSVHGSSYKAIEQNDLVRCDDPWFRPVDIKLAPDGSMYIADFYNCLIGHYEVPLNHPRRDREKGRIWRVSYQGDGSIDARVKSRMPDLATASVRELVQFLADPNLVNRTQATHQLVHRIGPDAAGPVRTMLLSDTSTPEQRAHGLWVLERLGVFDAALVQRLIADKDRLVRVHVTKMLAGRSDWKADGSDWQTVVVKLLQDDDAFVRRAAADALGLHPDPRNLTPVVQLWIRTPAEDTHLIHTTRMAIRDTLQGAPDAVSVAKSVQGDAAVYGRLLEISLGMRTPQGGRLALAFLQAFPAEAAGSLAALVQHAGRYLPPEQLPTLYDFWKRERSKWTLPVTVDSLRGLQKSLQERGAILPADVRTIVRDMAASQIKSPSEAEVRTGIELVREFQLKEHLAELEGLSQPQSRLAPLRQTAIEALIAIDAARAIPLLKSQVAQGDLAVAVRQKSAELLGSINSQASRDELRQLLRVVPEQVALGIGRALSKNKEGAEVLFAAVKAGQTSPRLLQDAVVQGQLKGAKIPNLDQQLEPLLKDLPAEDEKVAQLLKSRIEGFSAATKDPAKGAEIFARTCANCHRLANKGQKVGPDLDGIAVRGLERLVEDVLNPNRNVDAAFRSTTLALTDGKLVSGLVLREEGEIVIVVNGEGKEVRVEKKAIEERRVMNLSPMPANIAEQLSPPDFQHLMSYLLSQNSKPAAAK